MKAQILTPWTGTGTEFDPYRPLLDQVLSGLPGARYKDVTGQPNANIIPNPNIFTAEIEADPAAITAIEADPRFFVLWKE